MTTATDLELELIAHLDFPHEISCDYGECQAVATHLALCPKCPAHEYFCAPHVQKLRKASPNLTGTFDKSCGHQVRNGDVKFLPIL
jgi:hypothetical protein